MARPRIEPSMYETIRRPANNRACNCIFSYWVRRVLPFSVFCFGVKHSTEMPVESSIYIRYCKCMHSVAKRQTNVHAPVHFNAKWQLKLLCASELRSTLGRRQVDVCPGPFNSFRLRHCSQRRNRSRNDTVIIITNRACGPQNHYHSHNCKK